MLLPCERCQLHYVKNYDSMRRRFGEPKDAMAAFEWIYHLKDHVNKITKRRSIPLSDLRERYEMSGGRMDDLLVAETLLLMALFSETHGTDCEFVDFCHSLHSLMPLPDDSELVFELRAMEQPIVSRTYRALKNVCIEHGVACTTLAAVRRVVDDDSGTRHSSR